MQKPFKLRYASQIAGTFVILALTLLMVGIFVASNQQGWFDGEFTLRTKFGVKTGSFGLREGNDVMIMGTLAGRVGQIKPNADGRMETTFIIKNSFKQFVQKDSIATVRKKFVAAGDSFVEIEPGQGSEVLNGDYITCSKDEEIMETAQALLSDVQKVVVPMVEEVQELLEHVNAILTDLEEGKGIAGALINDPALAKDVKEVVHNSNLVIKESQKTFRETTRLIRAAQKSWFFRKHVEQDVNVDELLSPLYMSDDALASLRDFAEDALAQARAENKPVRIAHNACLVGYTKLLDGKHKEVQLLLDEARVELASAGRKVTYPILLEAELLRKKGQDKAAMSLVLRAMKDLKRSERELHVQCLLMIADILCDLNMPAQSRESLKDASYYVKKLKSPAVSASAEHIMGRIHDIEKDYKNAGAKFDDESQLRRNAGQFHAMIAALDSSAKVYEKLGDHDKSADRYFRAGRSLLYSGESKAAENRLQKALFAAKKSDNEYIANQATVILNKSRE